MKQKLPLLIIIALIALSGVFYFYGRKNLDQPQVANIPKINPSSNYENTDAGSPANLQIDKAPAPQKAPANKSNPQPAETGRYSDESDITGPDIMVYEIVYDNNGFSPADLSLNKNDIVIFKNISDRDFWPASDSHPSHLAYPEFDAKRKIPSGKDYQFSFSKKGDWSYHDHLNPGSTGMIRVK